MECLHGKATSYNLLEGIYANAVAHEVERLCVDSCNGCQVGHPSQRQHDCLMMNENERWQMYGLRPIYTVRLVVYDSYSGVCDRIDTRTNVTFQISPLTNEQ